MKAHDFMDVAWEWVGGLSEAEWRSAVSRGYYAAFHVARDLLQECGFMVPEAEQAHGFLWLRLASAGHPDVEEAGRRLRYLRSLRNWADYDLHRPFSQSLAVAWVQKAEDIIQVLEAVPAAPTTIAQITAAIQLYERNVLKQVTWKP